MKFKEIASILSRGGVTPIEQVDITGNMNVEEKLSEISKSMPTGSMYVKRIRTIDLTTADPHLGQKVWFMIGFQHTPSIDNDYGYGLQIFFSYIGNDILIRRHISNPDRVTWVKFQGTVMS